MAGRRLLDAALLYSATRNVARQHFRIRGEQLDIWSRTSTLAKTLGLRRVRAVDIQAQNPIKANVVHTQRTEDTEAIPRQESVQGSAETAQVAGGIKQDHHYDRNQENASKEPVNQEGLGVVQEKPANVPTPDGTLPPRGVPASTPDAKTINTDVEQDRTDSGVQEQVVTGNPDGQDKGLDPQSAVPAQDEVPEGINTDVFHSPRIAKMMGGRTFGGGAQKVTRNPYARPAVAIEGTAASEQQVTKPAQSVTSPKEEMPVVQSTTQSSPSQAELQELAAELASDATLSAEPKSEVSLRELKYYRAYELIH
jgi:hypothetical protein